MGIAEGRRTGDYNKPTSYETSLRLEVQGLNVFDILRVERLAIRMSSSHPGPPVRTSDLGDGDLSIRVEECRIEGLEVAGTRVELDVSRVAAFRESLATHAGILAEAKKQRRSLAGRGTIDTLLFDGGRAVGGPARGGVVVGSGTRVRGKASYDEQSCVIVVPGLGTVYFGEVLSTKDSRRINLVRIAVDRPAPGRAPLGALGPVRAARAAKKKDDEIEKGEILISSVEINGSTFP
jgi:hypothetical protein